MIGNDILEKALLFAIKEHKGQKRKGNGLPYIFHPLRVGITLYENKISKNINLLLTASVLHDLVEDCGVSIKKIAKKFGHQIAALVEELTLNKDNYQLIGKTKYLCQEVLKMSSYALCIKLCDRFDNVRDTTSMPTEFKDKYFKETKEIIATLEENRKLTKTHKKLISIIKKQMSK